MGPGVNVLNGCAQVGADNKLNNSGTLYENYWRKANGQQDVQGCPKKVYPQFDLYGCPQPMFTGTDSNTVCSNSLRTGTGSTRRDTDSCNGSRPFSATIHANHATQVCYL